MLVPFTLQKKQYEIHCFFVSCAHILRHVTNKWCRDIAPYVVVYRHHFRFTNTAICCLQCPDLSTAMSALVMLHYLHVRVCNIFLSYLLFLCFTILYMYRWWFQVLQMNNSKLYTCTVISFKDVKTVFEMLYSDWNCTTSL